MTTKEKAEVMLAFDRGEKIEYKYLDGEWQELNSARVPDWNWASFDYRVKQPEPFVYSGPGKYRMRNGEERTICFRGDGYDFPYTDIKTRSSSWNSKGRWLNEGTIHPCDLVGTRIEKIQKKRVPLGPEDFLPVTILKEVNNEDGGGFGYTCKSKRASDS